MKEAAINTQAFLLYAEQLEAEMQRKKLRKVAASRQFFLMDTGCLFWQRATA